MLTDQFGHRRTIGRRLIKIRHAGHDVLGGQPVETRGVHVCGVVESLLSAHDEATSLA